MFHSFTSTDHAFSHFCRRTVEHDEAKAVHLEFSLFGSFETHHTSAGLLRPSEIHCVVLPAPPILSTLMSEFSYPGVQQRPLPLLLWPWKARKKRKQKK